MDSRSKKIKKNMKTFITCIILTLFLLTNSIAQQKQKVFVSEDTFVQAGETSNQALGTTNSKQLQIMDSDGTNKYARATYLKFIIPKEIKAMESVTLNLPIRITNRNKDGIKAKFKLDVYTVLDNKWDESSLTHDSGLESARLVGSVEIDPTGKETVWQEINLNTYAIFKLTNSQRKRTITLVLKNTDFNRTSAILPSKDKSKNSASFLTIK